MAAVTLGSKAEGSIVKIKESGVLVNFFIAKQNYESGLNGSGRVLVVRKDYYDQRQWHSYNINAYATSAIDTWLNGTYKTLLDANIRAQMGTTKFYYTPGNLKYTVTTLERSVFLLSATELGWTHTYLNAEGTALSSTVLGNAVSQWTRSPNTGVGSDAWTFAPKGATRSSDCTSTCGVCPAFMLPSTLYVSDDGSVFVNTAPSVPASITVPTAVNGGASLTVSWGAATDSDGNLSGYELERQYNGGGWAQIYKGANLSYTDAITKGWTSVAYRVRAYDKLNAYSAYTTSPTRTVNNNTAPGTPASITIPSSISGGTNITVSWGASTDAEGNLSGYKVEKSVNGGTYWTQIYQGPAVSTTDNVAFGTVSVMYRVKAYDTEGLESGWRTSGQVTVVNNRAPGAPPSITVPNEVKGGASLTVSWGAATDSDGNLSGYELERQVGGGGWSQVYKGANLSYTDSITKGWASVAYRVRAYDKLNAYSAYTTSPTRTVNNNTAPVITCGTPSGSSLGTKAEGFTVSYSVSDADADAVTVTEAIDGAVKRSFTAVLGQNNTFDVTGETFMKLLNGKHTLTVTANDGKASTVHSLTFTKEVTSASITLSAPMTADAEITLAALSVLGSIPADAEYKVEATNNGKDAQPVWQDVTAEVKSGTNILFTNHTASKGFAFNFRVTVKRGKSGQSGYITSVQGGFQ